MTRTTSMVVLAALLAAGCASPGAEAPTVEHVPIKKKGSRKR